MADPKPKEKKVSVDLSIPVNGFRKSVFFNWFKLEPIADGCLIQIAYFEPGQISQIHSFVIPMEGIINVRKSAETYITDFSVENAVDQRAIKGERLAPDLVNFLRLARTGDWAEIWFVLVPMMEIASASRGDKKDGKAGMLGAAIAHSSFEIHQQLVLSLFECLPAPDQPNEA